MAIVVANLRKVYNRLVAVDDLSFSVPDGSLFAFLGANGAGKSTTIGCITTSLTPTAGSIEVNGHDVVTQSHSVRRQIGAVFQSSLLDPLLSVAENLTLRGRLYGLRSRDARARLRELSRLTGVEEFLHQRYGLLSGGQKRRADIARALMHRPAVLFLDEPTAGLDPQSREQIWSAISGLRESEGTTVFLTTHYMEETERADSVCIIDQGKIVAEGTPVELRARYSSSVLTIRGKRLQSVLALCAQRGVPAACGRDGEAVVNVDSAGQAYRLLSAVEFDDFEFRHGTMDDVFLSVTKREQP
ncbi:MAG: ABC transporter ATP-binding protein [Micrococcales bacterium]|nr:ABC transporter ATP-binding protein [Micrococcales bacterium]